MNASSTALTPLVCPLCQAAVQRIHRRPIDRLASLFRPAWRFRCVAPCCAWEALVPRGSSGSRRGALGTLYSGRPVLEASRAASGAVAGMKSA